MDSAMAATGVDHATFGRRLATWQGGYYVATGLWPLVHMRSFEAVTGPKRERWLVKMVGLLAAAIGFTLLRGARRVSPEVRTLGITSAAAFAAVDLWYGGPRQRISSVYLADGVAEVGLVALWFAAPAR